MPQELFEFLGQNGYGLNRFDDVDSYHEIKDKNDLANLVKIQADIHNYLPFATKHTSSPSQFIANSTLAGEPHPCANIECRLQNVDAMAQFAALYADTILLPNPFQDLLDLSQDLASIDDRTVISTFLEIQSRIAILLRLHPLIETGYIKFVETEHYNFCPDCYAEMVGQTKSDFREYLKEIHDYFYKRFVKDTNITLHSDENMVYANVRGPADLIEHGSIIHVCEKVPKKLEYKINNKDILVEPEDPIFDSLVDGQKDPALNDILRRNYYSNQFNVNYLTQREIDAKLIQNIGDPKDKRATWLLAQTFSHTLPTIENSKIESLLKLRENETDSFDLYRDALQLALKESQCEDPVILKELFDDLVRPEINKIESTVQNAKRALRRDISKDIVVGAGFVSIGLFGGFLPPNIGKIISALGGIHYSSKLFENVRDLFLEPLEARKEKFYFLWKVQKKFKH